MSYREVSVEKRYNVQCTTCTFSFEDASSAGAAEELAVDHIMGDVGEGDAGQNYNHEVTITEVTKVGRNI